MVFLIIINHPVFFKIRNGSKFIDLLTVSFLSSDPARNVSVSVTLTAFKTRAKSNVTMYLPFPSSPRARQEIYLQGLRSNRCGDAAFSYRHPDGSDVSAHFFSSHLLSIRLSLKLERGARPPIYLPFLSSPRILQEIQRGNVVKTRASGYDAFLWRVSARPATSRP